MAERELIYRIKFVKDAASETVLRGIAKEGIEAERLIERTSIRRRKAADDGAREAKREADARIKEEQRAARELERIQQRQERDRQRAEREAQRLSQRQAREAEKLQQAETREREKAAREAQRIQQRTAKEQASLLRQQEREQALATRRAEQEAAKEAKAKEKAARDAAKAHEREAKKAADAERRERAAATAAANAEQAKLGRIAETSQARLLGARKQLAGAFAESTEGVMRLTRGFVALELVGEKDLETLARSLVKLQAGIDIVAGGMKLWMKSAEAVKAYRDAVQAAAVAESALAALRLRSGAGQAAGNVGGAVTSAAGAVTPGLAAKTAAGGTAATVGGGAAVGAGGTVLAFLAAVASSGAALKILYETVTGNARAHDSWSMKIATWEVKFAEFAKIVDVGSKTVEAAEERRAALLDQIARREARAEIMAPLASRGLSTQQAIEDATARFGRTEQFRPAELGVFRQTAERQFRETGVALSGASRQVERGVLLERQEQLAARIAKLAEDRFDTERQLRDKAKQGAEEQLRLRREELDTVRDQLKERRESLMSAAERFGQLSPQEQARAVMAQQKAQRSGPQSLTKEERQTLRGIGLSGTTAAARTGDILDAERAGFSRFFGAEERRDIAQLGQQERRTTLKIEGQRELLIRIEQDEQRAVQQAATEIADLVKQREDAITSRIKEEVKNRLAELNRNQTTVQRQRAAAAQ